MNLKLIPTLITAATLFVSPLCFALDNSELKIWQDAVAQEFNHTVEMRHYLHANGELGNQEYQTQKYIADFLKAQGIEVTLGTQDAPTAVIGVLNPKKGHAIGLRADIDALPIKERNDLPYASKAKGKMFGQEVDVSHMCGHDAHMTILLSLAKILMDNRKKIKGTVKLLFQPDEEGDAGAKFMVENGALENPKVDKAFAIHVWSEFKEDEIAIKEGTVMASSDPYDIIVYGKGGHAAMPEKCIDTIYIANKIGIALKEMARLDVEPEQKAIIGATAISGGKTNNVIPDVVHMKGICRTNNNEVRKEMKKKIVETVEGIAKEMGGRAEIKFLVEYPVTVNSKEEVETVQEIARKVVNNVVTDYQTTTSEDFSYYLEKVPGCMIFVGCRRNKFYPQHSENFTVGENPILIGTEVFYEIAKKYLM